MGNLFIATCALFFRLSSACLAASTEDARLLVHILDYVAKDYPQAVDQGKILHPEEYEEQLTFVASAIEIQKKLNLSLPLVEELSRLKKSIRSKAPAVTVATQAQQIKKQVIEVSGLEVAPPALPNLHHGKKLFGENCSACHGQTGRGDGPSGGSLRPPPTNFHDAAKVSSMTPFQSFNAIRLGVSGTAMAAFPNLTDSDVWDLAFYVNSLKYRAKEFFHGPLPSSITLRDIATFTDKELGERLKGSPLQVTQIRNLSAEEKASSNASAFTQQALQEILSSYRNEDYETALRLAMVAYLEGIEPIEPRLRARDPKITATIEGQMALLRAMIKARRPADLVEKQVEEIRSTLQKIDEILTAPKTSPWMTFSLAAGIFLREAFEATLLLITLLGVVRTLGSRKATAALHLGWMSAVVVGFVCWFFSGWLLQMSGLQRELLEGIISALAVFILLYMGFWLHRKSEMGRWRSFISDMARTASEKTSLIGFFGIAFMAVFREAFETVLFLRALSLEEGAYAGPMILAGVTASLIAVMGISVALVRFSHRIPVRQLFDVSSLVMIFLSFTLIGKALHSFQETGLLSINEFPWSVRIDLLGIYPTYETLLPQVIVLFLTMGVWLWGRQGSNCSSS